MQVTCVNKLSKRYCHRARFGRLVPSDFQYVRTKANSTIFSCSRKIKLRIRRARDIVEKRPVAYVPLGTYEWHGEHLPVGLDALTAHGICLRAAVADGGVVLPAMHYGCGGGHGAYPWTVIPSQPDHIEPLLDFTLQRLETNGVKLAVLFSGHFAPTQLDMIDRLAKKWNDRNRALRFRNSREPRRRFRACN
jgi:Creatinine amidohydrolase